MYNKKTILKGTFILTAAGLITRIIGFFNRIFLADLMGARELGVYQLIFPVYTVAFSFCCQGIQTALTKLVSEYYAKNETCILKRLLSVSLTISCSLGFLCFIVIYHFAPEISIHVLRSKECIPYLRIIAFGVPLIAVKGCINGFFLGMKNSSVSAVSLLIEQSARVIGIYLLSLFLIAPTGFDASIVVYGPIIGEIFSCLYAVIRFVLYSKKNPLFSAAQSTDACSLSFFSTGKLLLKDCIPLTANRLSLTLLQSLESVLIPGMLYLYYQDNNLSLELYGILTGMSLPFIMFPSTITNSLSTMLLPAVSSANATKDTCFVRSTTEQSIHFCSIIGILSAAIFIIFGKELGIVVFDNQTSGEFLVQMALLCPFIYIATTLSSILNGLGKTTLNLLFFIISISIRIAFILFVVPVVGIKGYMWGLLISYLLLTMLVLIPINQLTHIHFNNNKSILLPAFTAIILGSAAYLCYIKLCTMLTLPHLLLLGGCLCLYVLIYAGILYALKVIRF